MTKGGKAGRFATPNPYSEAKNHMLEQMRDHSRSLLIYLLFGIIIAVFVVSFGPQSVGGFDSSGASVGEAAAIRGHEVSAQEFRQAFLLAQGDRFDPEQAKLARVRETLLDRLIARELFAQEAAKLGLVVGREEAEDFIAQGQFMQFGQVRSFAGDKGFDYDEFTRFVRYYGFTPATFIELQQRELQAERFRKVLKEGVTVSPAEVKAEWEFRNTQINLEYLRFPIGKYQAQVAPSADEITAYAAAHEKALEEAYEKDKAFRFTKVPKERRLEIVRVALPAEASDADKQAAVAKLEPVAKAAAQGLAVAAKKLVADPKSGVTYEAPAWRREGAAGLGSEVSAQVAAAAEGAVVGPVQAEGAVVVVKVGAAREGDLAFADVRNELAEEAMRRDVAEAKAKAAAEAALAKAKQALTAAPDKTLKDVFPGPSEQPAPEQAGDAPRAEETGSFVREGNNVEGIGRSAELAKAVWALTKEAPFHGPAKVAGAYVVVRLKERQEPDATVFESSKESELQMAEDVKAYQVVFDWSSRACKAAKDAKQIKVNPEILVYPDGKPSAVKYEPCSPSPFGLGGVGL